jgi:hypothetical protein
LILDVDALFFVHSNELKILPGDVIIIIFHLSKCFFMIDAKLIDMLILSFFNFMHFNFSS